MLAVERVGVLEPQLSRVPALALEVGAEFGILLGDGVLVDVRQEEEHQTGRQDAQTGGDVEGVLVLLVAITTGRDDVGKDVSTNKGANLAHGSRHAIVLTTDTRGTGLCGEQTNVVARAQLAEREEDTVDDGKSTNVLRQCQSGIAAGHDEADNGLQSNAEGESVTRTETVTDGRTDHGSGNVEQVDDGVPAKDCRQGSFTAVDIVQHWRRVDSERIDGELIFVD